MNRTIDDPGIQALRDHVARARRKVRHRRIGAVVVVGFLSAWGAWLHDRTSKLDAEGAVLLAREQVVSMMPEAEQALKLRLAQRAPAVVDRAIDTLHGVPQRLRLQVQDDLLGVVDQEAREAGERLGAALDFDMEEARRLVRREFPGLSEEERLLKLSERTIQDLRQRLTAFVTGHADGFASRMREFEDQILGLGDPSGLTRKGRIQRQILIVSLELVNRARERGESLFPEGSDFATALSFATGSR